MACPMPTLQKSGREPTCQLPAGGNSGHRRHHSKQVRPATAQCHLFSVSGFKGQSGLFWGREKVPLLKEQSCLEFCELLWHTAGLQPFIHTGGPVQAPAGKNCGEHS